jgi:hypothetical protein
MKKKKLTVEEIIIPFDGVVYNNKIINYRSDGSIISISNEKESDLFLEIENDLIPNFINGNKNFHLYTIDYFKKIKRRLITDEDELDTVVRCDYMYSIIEENKNSEFSIVKDTLNRKWIVTISDNVNKDSVEDFYFYSVLKTNKSFVLGLYSGSNVDFSDKKIEFNFISELEDTPNVLLLTNNKSRYSLESIS